MGSKEQCCLHHCTFISHRFLYCALLASLHSSFSSFSILCSKWSAAVQPSLSWWPICPPLPIKLSHQFDSSSGRLVPHPDIYLAGHLSCFFIDFLPLFLKIFFFIFYLKNYQYCCPPLPRILGSQPPLSWESVSWLANSMKWSFCMANRTHEQQLHSLTGLVIE